MSTAEMNVAMRDSTTGKRYLTEQTSEADVLVSAICLDEEIAAQWDAIIDDRLIEWGQYPNDFELDGLVAPSDRAIRKAYALLKFMRSQDWPLPTSVIADGEGGIVFENRRDPDYQRIEISDQGDMYLVTFRDRRMQGRPEPIDFD